MYINNPQVNFTLTWGFRKNNQSFLYEARNRGYENVSMHARVSEGLSNIMQKRYGAKFFRRIENWHDFGEPFDYLEIDLKNKIS